MPTDTCDFVSLARIVMNFCLALAGITTEAFFFAGSKFCYSLYYSVGLMNKSTGKAKLRTSLRIAKSKMKLLYKF